MREIKFRTEGGQYLTFEVPETAVQYLRHDTNGAEIYEGDIYFDVDTQTQTHAPCIDELVNEALGYNIVSLDCYEIERAKKTLVEAT